ncbi:MAG: hypothetical protein ABI779_18725 [Acidobacteriota bacterium]
MAPVALADYEAQFRSGITAMDRRRWAEAAAAMRKAIAENPQESSRKVFIYGTRYVEYTPHFFLGVALSKSNNCRDAVTAMKASEQQGVIKRMANYRELLQITAVCAQDAPASVSTEPTQQPEIKKPEIQKTEPQKTEPEPSPSVSPQTIPAPVPVKPQPSPATTITKPSVNPAPLLPPSTAPDLALVSARQKLDDALSDSRSLLDQAKPPARAAASRDALRRAVAAAAIARNPNSAQAVQSAAKALSDAGAGYRRALATVPGGAGAQLAEAVRSYIRGDYKTTAALLERAKFESSLERAQAALFRAAARYAMYTLEGSRNAALRSQAVADLREYRRIDATRPDARLFPPPFQRLYAEIR